MAYNLIGKDFTPMDVEAKVTGRAKYAEDFRADNMVFCKTLASPIPHAKIRSIDTSEALKIPGVLGILTADDGFKNAKVTIEESFVTGTYSHNCMETRTAFAYWQGGKCFLHGSNQSHTAAIANIARYIGIPPENLVLIAEYCGGGFGSKIP